MTRTRFTKGHGTRNDFVLLADTKGELDLTPELVRALADRRGGIGGDGVIRLVPTALVPDDAVPEETVPGVVPEVPADVPDAVEPGTDSGFPPPQPDPDVPGFPDFGPGWPFADGPPG